MAPPCRGVSDHWRASCDFARCTVSVDQSSSEDQTSHFPHPLAGGGRKSANTVKYCRCYLEGQGPDAIQNIRAPQQLFFPRPLLRAGTFGSRTSNWYCRRVRMQDSSFRTAVSRQDSRDFLELAVVHRCQYPTDLLVTEGGHWCCGARNSIASPGAARIWGHLCYKFTPYCVPGGKMPDTLKRWSALFTLGSMQKRNYASDWRLESSKVKTRIFPNDFSSSAEINGQHWDLSTTQIST